MVTRLPFSSRREKSGALTPGGSSAPSKRLGGEVAVARAGSASERDDERPTTPTTIAASETTPATASSTAKRRDMRGIQATQMGSSPHAAGAPPGRSPLYERRLEPAPPRNS